MRGLKSLVPHFLGLLCTFVSVIVNSNFKFLDVGAASEVSPWYLSAMLFELLCLMLLNWLKYIPNVLLKRFFAET